jgi:hypothetical protein
MTDQPDTPPRPDLTPEEEPQGEEQRERDPDDPRRETANDPQQ